MSLPPLSPVLPPQAPSLRTLVGALDARAARGDSTLALREVIDHIGTSAHAPAILALALPMVIPMPPGLPTLAGVLIALTALFWLLGRGRMALPRRLDAARLKIGPLRRWVARLERWLEPLTGTQADLSTAQRRTAAALCVALGLLMALPIPLVGNIPPAIAVCTLALAIGFGAAAVELAARLLR